MTETFEHLDEKRRKPSMPYPHSPSADEDWELKINEKPSLSREELAKLEFDRLEKRTLFRKDLEVEHCICLEKGSNND